MGMTRERAFIHALGKADLNIADEIGETIQSMYLAITRVDLDANEAVILHGDGAAVVGSTCSWDAYLAYYVQTYIKLPDHRRMQRMFSLDQLRHCWQEGRTFFSCDFTSRLIGRNEFYITVTAFLTVKAGRHYAYVLVRNADSDNILLSIVKQYVYDVYDYFIYLDAANNSYTMFSGLANTPLPPVQCLDYEKAVVEYAREFVTPEDQERVIDAMHLANVEWHLKHQRVYSFTCGVIDEHGRYTRKRLEYRYHDRENHMILLSRIDITNVYREERQAQQKLEAALLRAQSDPLTKLWNFQATMDNINTCLAATERSYALFFVDLDNFKWINDTFGHAVGDRVLRELAGVLMLASEETDVVGRVGGDEFVFFAALSTGDVQEVKQKVQHIADQIRQVPIDAKGKHTVSGSIGIAIAPRDGQDYYTLIEKADAGMYRVKKAGKDGYSF